MEIVNMKNIIVEIKNRINKIYKPKNAAQDQTEHSQKVTEKDIKKI